MEHRCIGEVVTNLSIEYGLSKHGLVLRLAVEGAEITLIGRPVAHASAEVEAMVFIEGGEVRDPLRIAGNDRGIAFEILDLGLGIAGATRQAEPTERGRKDLEWQRSSELNPVEMAALAVRLRRQEAHRARRRRGEGFDGEGRIIVRNNAVDDVAVEMLVEGLERDIPF